MPVAGTENILLLVLLAAAFYVLILRPQRTRARALREVRSSLAVAGSARRRRRRAGRATRCFRCQPRASPLRFGVRGQIARVRRTRRRAEEIAVRRGSGASLRPSDKSRLRAPADRTTPVPAAGVPAAPTRGGANRAGWRPARAAFGRAAPPEPGTARPLPRPSPVPLPRRPPGWTGPPDRRRTVGPGLRARPGRAGPGRARPRRTPRVPPGPPPG